MAPRPKNGKITEEQLKLLATTPEKDMVRVFKGTGLTRERLREERRRARAKYPEAAISAKELDQERIVERNTTQKEMKLLIDQRNSLEKDLRALRGLIDARDFRNIKIKSKGKKRESTLIALASDWHAEEPITREETNGLNYFDLTIFDERSDRYFRSVAKLVEKEQHDAIIRNGLLWLGGDFITGSIHEELMESNLLEPVNAAILVTKKLAAGIRYLLDNTDVEWSIPCSVGNHERTTLKRRVKGSIGNSLATFIYYTLAMQFENESRVRFALPESYFNYVDVHGYQCRFHHGDSVTYGGGIGGLHIPLRKKIDKWNTGRRADYDFLGHFHQFMDGGHYMVNGSLNGYNAYAMSIAAIYEAPRQGMCLIDSDYGKTVVAPIIVAEPDRVRT